MVSVFTSIFSMLERQVQAGTALRTNGSGHCGKDV